MNAAAVQERRVAAEDSDAGRESIAGRVAAAGRALAVCLALAMAVGIRWRIFQTAALDGLTEGVIFGFLLTGVALLGGQRLSWPRAGALAAGLAAGSVLVVVSVAARWPIPPLALGHAAPFVPWIAVTTLVATGEELILRGALWHWVCAAGGDATALLTTSLLFALIHVPVYGWHVVPLDFGVGLIFGGLRLWFGGPAAPAAAHVLADLATWWL
jgi:membrane protease YdiL (CAAX protease family)